MSLLVAHASRPAFRVCIVAAALLTLAVITTGCEASATAATQDTALARAGSTQSTPEITTESSTSTTTSSTSLSSQSASSGFFDTATVHEIAVSFSPEDYDAMIQTYQETGEKEWIESTVTIDGETYDNVGLRLKGNSSIMGLRQRGVDTQAVDGRMGGNAPNEAGQGFVQRAGGPGADASADIPEGLPWLIDLDKFVDNQNHEGVVEVAVRSNTSETALNEAVSLDLLREAGLASEKAVYVSFSINGSEPVLRLVVENPDDMWMAENFDISGALFKAESTGDYSYRGEDPGSYDEVFDQEAGKTNADLTPLIEFLDFINNSGDVTFNAELPDRLDIDDFATYLAMQEVINNFDDIDGPGNNSYLYYDTKTERFTVVAWDHNLAFGGVGGGGFAGRQTATFPSADGQDPTNAPVQPAQGAQRPQGGQAQAGNQGRLEGGAGREKSNILVDRFKANPEWQQLYEDRLAELRSELYGSGKAADILATWVAVLKTEASALIDASTVDQEAANISKYFTAQ